MKTKLFTLLLAVAVSIGTMFAEKVQIGDLYYNLDATNQTAEVTFQLERDKDNYKGLTDANIPASVEFNSVTYSVTSIGGYAFYDCYSLNSVTIPNSVISIGDAAFYNCSGLTSVTIPNSVTSIGVYAFLFCSGLTSIDIDDGNQNYCSLDGVLFSIDKTTLIQHPGGKQGAYIIPSSVTSIGECAFHNCAGLTSVSIPNSVTGIGDYAFYRCTGLTSIEIPNSVTSIGKYAFNGCSGLTSVTIPSSVTSIGELAFAGCSGLTLVTIGNSVTSIGELAFAGCSSLTSIDVATDNPNYSSSGGVLFNKGKTTLVAYPGGKQGAYTIPNSVTSIGDWAFSNCSGLTSVTIPNSVTSIGNYAFYYCKSLSSIYNYATSPQVIDSDVFGGDEYEEDGIQYGPVDKSICKLYVPQESINFYKVAEGWKEFVNILPIGAQTVDVTTTTVTPSATTADIAWPQVSDAASYELVIKDKNGNVVCTLVFDAEGRLTSINFAAPGKDHNRQQTQTAGFTFSITGLESGTTYNYTLTTKDSNGNVLKTETGTFTTEGAPQGIEEPNPDPSLKGRGQKVVRDGKMYIIHGEKVYTVTGQEVK